VVAVHVHHGLQPAADIWPAHCEARARALGIGFECVRLQDGPPRGASLEAWARDERYRALAAIARRLGARAALTAHHADDQVETVLMRLARGTGIDGLAGIEPATTLAGVAVLRPLLALRRAELARYARAHGLRWIEDPSNVDTRRTRNALRHQVLPAIDARMPGFRRHLLDVLPQLRAARDAQAALAAQDLERARSGAGLDRRALRTLPEPRRHAALRAWLRELGLRMPSGAKLLEIDRQLVGARGAYGHVLHEGVALSRNRDEVRAMAVAHLPQTPVPMLELRWSEEARIDLPDGHGRLLFEPVLPGAGCAVSARWLAAQPLTVSPGGVSSDRLRPRRSAHRRTLKNLYQERGVPAWLRPLLPVVHIRGRLLYASALGMDCDEAWPAQGECVGIRWQPGDAQDPRWPWCA
jgi:tRNA(Ile)-lysidine synthase